MELEWLGNIPMSIKITPEKQKNSCFHYLNNSGKIS
jgi:hypothetical protein